MGDATFTQGFAALKAREDESDGAEHEVGTCAACDAQLFLAVDGEVIAEYAKAEAEGNHVDTKEPAAKEKKAVPTKAFVQSIPLVLSISLVQTPF